MKHLYFPQICVTEDEWNAAFDLGNNWTAVTEAIHSGYKQKATITQKRDGNKFQNTQVVTNTESGATPTRSTMNFTYGDIATIEVPTPTVVN